jgi:hypothetical protein
MKGVGSVSTKKGRPATRARGKPNHDEEHEFLVQEIVGKSVQFLDGELVLMYDVRWWVRSHS